MTFKNHARCAAMLMVAALTTLAPPARAAGTTISWGASGGFHFCGSNSPAEFVFSHTTQFVAQLIWSPDDTRDSSYTLTPAGNDVLLDQVTVTISSGAGSAWGDFVGATYASATTLTGYVYGRIVLTPMWHWYGKYDGAVVSLSNTLASPPYVPMTYNFNTAAASETEVGWGGCLICMYPCSEPVLAIEQSNDAIVVTYQGTDGNAAYQLQATHDSTSGSWTNVPGTNISGGFFAVTNQSDGALFRINKMPRYY